mmetsp:Transcript_2701/g.6532  ORF Transcript_2701/g.6532 Transcript_2701/m.6532 type:complete len:241 (+) Transcript_2701:197-919(+)
MCVLLVLDLDRDDAVAFPKHLLQYTGHLRAFLLAQIRSQQKGALPRNLALLRPPHLLAVVHVEEVAAPLAADGDGEFEGAHGLPPVEVQHLHFRLLACCHRPALHVLTRLCLGRGHRVQKDGWVGRHLARWYPRPLRIEDHLAEKPPRTTQLATHAQLTRRVAPAKHLDHDVTGNLGLWELLVYGGLQAPVLGRQVRHGPCRPLVVPVAVVQRGVVADNVEVSKQRVHAGRVVDHKYGGR